jgi:hypothetical protein
MTHCLITAAEEAYARRLETGDAVAESEVLTIKARILRDMTAMDLAENMAGEWLDAALRTGDAELIGRCVLLAMDSYAERIGVRDVYGPEVAAPLFDQVNEDGWRLVAEYIARKAGAIQ